MAKIRKTGEVRRENGAEGQAENYQMTDIRQMDRGLAYWLIVIGKWWVRLVALFFALGAAIAGIVALVRVIDGNPEWEGIVMVPEVLGFAILLCLPGAVLFALGRLIMPRN